MSEIPPLSEVYRFVDGGFWDVATIGWPAEFQVAVWLLMTMVAVSALNLVGAVPVIPVTPRTASGAVGIATAPFMHGSPLHLAANGFGLLVLGYLLSLDHDGVWTVVAAIALISGAVYWAVGPSGGGAVGASDTLFGMWAYWMVHQWTPLDADKIAYLGVMTVVFAVFLWQAFAPTDGGRLAHLIGACVGAGIALNGF